MDLGSGGGFDCFLASNQVEGSWYGVSVDMTPEKVSGGRKNVYRGFEVAFRVSQSGGRLTISDVVTIRDRLNMFK